MTSISSENKGRGKLKFSIVLFIIYLKDTEAKQAEQPPKKHEES